MTPPPPPPADFSDIACGTDELVTKLKADPSSLSGCSAASIRGADMPALVDAGVSKEQLLAVWSLDGATGFTPKQLKEAGITIAQMQSAGLTISQIHAGGVSVADLRTAGVTIADLLSAGVTTHELHSGGFTIADMQSAGLTISQIHAGGVSISDLQGAGLTLLQLYNGGISPAQLKEAEVTIAQMRSAGLTISQIHAGGVSVADLRTAGVTIAQMRNAGLTVSEIYAGGVSIADLLEEDGLNLVNLYTGGVPGYALFNEVCNTPPRSSGTAPDPTITITRLTAMSEGVELRATARGSTSWSSNELIGMTMAIAISNARRERTIGTVIGRYVMSDGNTLVSDLIIPFSLAFSNLGATVTVADTLARTTSIQLCPGG